MQIRNFPNIRFNIFENDFLKTSVHFLVKDDNPFT